MCRIIFLFFYYFCGMKSILSKYGNLPVTAPTLALDFSNIRKVSQKLAALERDGQLIKLKRGLYVCPEQITGVPLSLELIANRLLTPSYVSMSTALRYYGLIPEAVYVTQSVTTKEPREYETPVGRFTFIKIKKEVFSIGLRNVEENVYSFLIASPEKALCDLIAETPSLFLRYRKETLAYLEEDIRFDMASFYRLNPTIFKQYIAAGGKKATSINTVLNVLLNHG